MEEPILMRYIKKKGFKTVTDFYVEIAEERLDPNQVIDEYLEQLRRETETNDHTEVRSAEEYITTTEVEEISTNKDVLVIDKNLTGIEYKLAKCCNPIYGDEVFGFVSTQGIKIHRMDCPNAPRDVQPLRLPDHPARNGAARETMAIRLRCGCRTGRYSDRHQHHLRDRKGIERHASLLKHQLGRRIIPR